MGQRNSSGRLRAPSLQAGQKAAMIGPTFGEYRAASQAAGATVVEYVAQVVNQFHLDLASISEWLQVEGPALLWLCNPNNPMGLWLDRQADQRKDRATQ